MDLNQSLNKGVNNVQTFGPQKTENIGIPIPKPSGIITSNVPNNNNNGQNVGNGNNQKPQNIAQNIPATHSHIRKASNSVNSQTVPPQYLQNPSVPPTQQPKLDSPPLKIKGFVGQSAGTPL